MGNEKLTTSEAAFMKHLIVSVGYRKSFGVSKIRGYTESGSIPLGDDALKQRLSRLLQLGLLTFGGTGVGGQLQYLLADEEGKEMTKKDLFGEDVADDTQREMTPEEVEEASEGGVVPSDSGLTLEAEKRAKDALGRVKAYLEDQAEKFLLLGGELRVVQREKYYVQQGFSKFDDYVEQIGIQRRTAYYYMEAYDYYCVKYSDADLVKAAKAMGFTKAQYLVDIITPDNQEEWVRVAGSMSTRDLLKKVKSLKTTESKKTKVLGDDDEDEDEGSGDSGGSSSGNESPSVMRTFALTPSQDENVKRCLELVATETNSEKPGHNLDVAATMLMSNYLDRAPMEEVLVRVERSFKVNALVFNHAWELVHGDMSIIDKIGRTWAESNGWVPPNDLDPSEDGSEPQAVEAPVDPEAEIPFDEDDE